MPDLSLKGLDSIVIVSSVSGSASCHSSSTTFYFALIIRTSSCSGLRTPSDGIQVVVGSCSLVLAFSLAVALTCLTECDNPEDPPRILPYSRLLRDLSQMFIHLAQINFTPPRWNFHLALHDGNEFVTLFDSLISRDSFSGEFSNLIPEVRIIDEDLVLRVLEFAAAEDRYLPTKAVARGGTWYVAFEYESVCGEARGRRPLLVFAYNSRNGSRWLPELDGRSSCRRVLPREYPHYVLPRLCLSVFSVGKYLATI
ncbi:hypothetical protein R1sor_026930 [Riccia sorocarpa]|uniref:Uncharacterized protein n=1 Tax=Riccia sorocarpa TaxID=122646 RepID=A0ABD3GCS3_9MARC